MNARIAGVSRNATIESPLSRTLAGDPLIDGNANSPKSVLAFAFTVATPGTKSPSITIAALGGFCQTLFTDVGKSVWTAPEVPPAIDALLRICPIVRSDAITEPSVHLIRCFVSWTYFAGPAWRR